ncbi:MAG: TonB-dependent receptor plug domain-containing protein, partial [Pseudomonadota bacterium]
MLSKNWLNSAFLISVLSFNSTAFAQDDTRIVIEDNVSLYTSDDLLAMQGQFAFDIIEQIAGFQFIDSNNQRGLSSASGNVLINGLPVLNKSQSLEAILSDLPISQIAEIEVYLAGHPFSSASQYTQMVNIIRDNSQSRANWQVGAKSQKDFNQVNAASLQASTQWLTWDHQLQLSTDKNVAYSTTDYTELNHQNISYLSGQEQYQESIENISTGITSSKVMTDSVL